MTRTATATPHRESHLDLLPPFVPDGMRPIDAVVVPTGRGAGRLRPAAELAAALGAPLLALCSARSHSAEVAAAVTALAALRCYAVDVGPQYSHPLLPHRPAVPGRGGRESLSRKRNIGLLVARMAGWNTILLVDDDIHALDPDQVRLSAGGLGTASAVGLAVADWPDNSVVCHANRLGGGAQSVFVSGSALLVDTRAEDLGHFPVVYNEDWLFLHDALVAGRVRRQGRVAQVAYDPFGDPRRGAVEEFGEVIAEGLVSHLEAGGTSVPLQAGFWADFLPRRDAFIRRSADRLAALPPSPRQRAALRALASARQRHSEIRPAHCLRFLRDWRADQDRWLDRLRSVTPTHDVGAALDSLKLRPHISTGSSMVSRPPRIGLATTVHRASEPRGTALLVPGFLDGRDSPACRSLGEALTSTGFTAVTFDPRGTGASPGTPADSAPTPRLRDLVGLLDEHAAPGPVTVVGHSYGAWLSGLLAADDERVTGVVALMPTRQFIWPHDYDAERDRWRRHGVRLFSAPDPGSHLLRTVAVPHAVVEDARSYDLPTALTRLRQPSLFVAGADDQVVPAAVVERLYQECGSPDKQLVVLPGVQHDYRDHPEQLAAVEGVVLRWLDERARG